jgi:small subunit ribosomal protein S17
MRKERKGKVISDKMDSTVIVEVVNLASHPIYKKIIRKKSKFVAHNPDNKAKLEDRVRIVETRPLSKTKRWRVVEILKTHAPRTQPSKRSSSSAKRKAVSKSKASSRKGKK